jgi:flavin reductase (DIM6/NTAB) family NADH-FMN oxidoreductase RutF
MMAMGRGGRSRMSARVDMMTMTVMMVMIMMMMMMMMMMSGCRKTVTLNQKVSKFSVHVLTSSMMAMGRGGRSGISARVDTEVVSLTTLPSVMGGHYIVQEKCSAQDTGRGDKRRIGADVVT